MSSEFDYQESIDIDQLLPPNIRTDITKAISSTGINRFFTSEDTIPVFGKIGSGMSSDIPSIIEENTYRQNNQLQPLIVSELPNETYINSFHDILNKLKQLGVTDNLDWLSCDQFNFMPPIDIDKFINYQDYYWVEDSTPDYITLNNPINRLNSIAFESNTSIEIQKNAELQKQNKALSGYIINHKYQWITNNHWVHKSELALHNIAKPAKAPILEFYDTLEVNEWTYTKHKWSYRPNSSSEWVSTNNEPTNDELNARFPIIDINLDKITIKGKITAKKISITNSNFNDKSYDVLDIKYQDNNSIITVNENLREEYLIEFDRYTKIDAIYDVGKFYGCVVPFDKTSLGDDWRGLFVHWRYDGYELQTPVNHQPENENQDQYLYIIPSYGLDINLFDGGKSNYGYDGQSRFTFPIDYIPDSDDIQVYLNGIRQYTSFSEGFYIDVVGRYDTEKYAIGLYDTPRFPKTLLSNCIYFDNQLNAGDKILIKIGASADSDKRLHGVYVQTSKGIEFKNLIKYRKKEQVKTKTNQYLNFDIYDINKSTHYSANPIFRYKEDITAEINKNTESKNLKINNSFIFENLLFNDELLCYKDYSANNQITTIWQKCRDKTTLNDIPQQITNNYNHQCKTELGYVELYEHFIDIINNQTSQYASGNRICKTLAKMNQIGGHIKEHNTSLDILVSLCHQNIVNILELIDFAKEEYSNNLKLIRNKTISDLPKLLEQYSTTDNEVIYDTLVKAIIHLFKTNSKLDSSYYDTTAYNGTTGFVNFIATLPILGLYKASNPIILNDGIINKARHHDGHLSNCAPSDIEFDTFIKLLQELNLLAIGDEPVPRKGLLWLNNNKLKRCYADYIQGTEPDGSKDKLWYNTANKTFWVYDNIWKEQAFDLWKEFRLSDVIANVLLDIENNLFERSKNIPLKMNISKYIGTNYVDFINYLKEYYYNYINSNRNSYIFDVFDISNAFTWNYENIANTQDMKINQHPEKWGAFWQLIYEKQYNTQYPHLEPWKLQNYNFKPTNWDKVYKENGQWTTTMWSNIKKGIIHFELPAPDSAPNTYNIISVNDTGLTIGKYKANALLPPYISDHGLSHNSLVSLLSTTFPNSIQDTVDFGKQDYNERSWLESIDYRYDFIKVLFRMNPMKFCFDTFGFVLTDVNGLLIDKTTKKVPCYKDIVYHGSVKNNNHYSINGLNQWFVNYLRFNNNTIGLNSFIELTTNWELKLGYQTNTVIDESTLDISQTRYDITKLDYKLALKKTNGAEEKWLHSLRIAVSNMPNFHVNARNTKVPVQDNWTFKIDALVPNAKITYYDVRRFYIKSVDVTKNTLKLHKKSKDPLGNVFYEDCNIPWDNHNVKIDYNYGKFNSEDYYGIQSTENGYRLIGKDQWGNFTAIKLYDEIICYTIGNTYTFDQFRLLENGLLLVPSKNALAYYDNKLYQYNDIIGKFLVIDGFTLPSNAVFEDIVPVSYEFVNNKCYLKYEPKQLKIKIPIPVGVAIAEYVDPFVVSKKWYHTSIDRTNPVLSTVLPIEIYSIQGVIDFIDGYHEYLKDNNFVFSDYENPYMLKDNSLMHWQHEIEQFVERIYYGITTSFNTKNKLYDVMEINPFKYALWINTPEGIIANTMVGPYRDISLHPSVYDQNGNPISSTENLKMIRTDKQTIFTYPETDTIPSKLSKYIGGMHLYLNYYEHAILFNNYTSTSNLIFDPFLGTIIDHFIVRFDKHYEVSKRPNLSGSILSDGKIVKNIESNLRQFRGLYGRELGYELLGYENKDYTKLLDPKSKFLFWKGMLQYKGTDKGFESLVQNADLSSLELDEIWCRKLADFGNNENSTEHLLSIKLADVKDNSLLYQIDEDTPEFVTINSDDQTRWSNGKNIFDLVEYKSYEFTAIADYPYIIFDEYFDDVIIEIELNMNYYKEWKYADRTIEVPYYIPDTEMMHIFVDGKKVNERRVDNTHIKMPRANKNSIISIVYKKGTLTKDHYSIIRNNIIKLDIEKFDKLTIKLMRYNYNELELQLVNNDVVIGQIQKYHPAYNLFNNDFKVDRMSKTDPANYFDERWDHKEVGTKWLDSSDYGLLPYYDPSIYSTMDMINYWGDMANWSDVRCYEWIESLDHPEKNPDALITLQKSTRTSIYEPFSEWFDEVPLYQIVYACRHTKEPKDITFLCDFEINEFSTYKCYKNEQEVSFTTNDNFVTVNCDEPDIIRFIKLKDNPVKVGEFSDEDLWKYQYKYNYNQVKEYSNDGHSFTIKYYYWVRNTLNRNPLSTIDIENTLKYNNNMYYSIIDKNKFAIYQVNIANDNYKLHILRNNGIQDNYNGKHNENTEWELLRKNYINKVPRVLWDKLIHSMIGMDYEGNILPSYQLVLKDKTNNTNYRYGIGSGQTMGEKQEVYDAVLDLLYSTEFDIEYDKDLFFEYNRFDNKQQIIESMDFIYGKLSRRVVNTIYFHILNILISRNTEIEGLFKSSMAVLDGQVELKLL